ncbi:hypothetical protein [Nocardia macrotermitis]|uniref:Uncharacterized protein n=1 Tax=Nocardia macrotermitis TaxID=2585198 RepID=A0A7K0CXM3_9NOCA|nr:hypothetical protein [Nocardia macrotermitis]MQY18250.1 hypothetical protein [Nocardia macrotermitis]
MRTLIVGATLTALAGTALTCAATAASAGQVVAQPDQGRIGVSLSHEETAALAEGPIPALIGKVVPLNHMGAGLHPGSRIYRDPRGGIHASPRELLLESAAHPDGNVIIYLDAPGTHGSRVLDIYEHWS